MTNANPNLVIEVPSITRTKESSADQTLVGLMAKQSKLDNWVTNGATYATYQEASNASQTYRRAVAASLETAPHKIKTRVWGLDGDKIVTDRKQTASWKFALAQAPNREKRVKTPKA